MGAHRVHHGRPRRDGATAQVVAIGEAAGQDDEVGAGGQVAVAMPDQGRLLARGQLQRIGDVTLAVRPGKDDDGGFHRWSPVQAMSMR